MQFNKYACLVNMSLYYDHEISNKFKEYKDL
jgi:hypothetical protein